MCAKYGKVAVGVVNGIHTRVKVVYRPEYEVYAVKVERDRSGRFHRGSKRGVPQFYAANLSGTEVGAFGRFLGEFAGHDAAVLYAAAVIGAEAKARHGAAVPALSAAGANPIPCPFESDPVPDTVVVPDAVVFPPDVSPKTD